MERIYAFRDPWNLDTPAEHARFRQTAELIRERLGARFKTILEIGCGEGLQTKYLSELADHLIGIDPSAHAIRRAQKQGIANAVFQVGDLGQCVTRFDTPFDLVVACEVLYYLEDLDFGYQAVRRLGKSAFITYYAGVFERLDPFFSEKPVQRDVIRIAGADQWRVIWWQ
jgi:predicted TPR repeat methyltransferase